MDWLESPLRKMGSDTHKEFMQLKLVTVTIIPDGCFGVLLDPSGAPVCLTLEPTDEELKTVIPAGLFCCRQTLFSGGGYRTHEIQVPGHTRLLIHRGNSELDTQGCVLLGLQLGRIGDRMAVLQSRKAYEHYWTLTRNSETYALEVVGRS